MKTRYCALSGWRKPKNTCQIYSDHNTPLITFGVSYREIRKGRKETVPGWKMTGEGLTEFLKLTSSEERSYLRDIHEYPDLEKCVNGILDQCFSPKWQPNCLLKGNGRISEPKLKSILEKLLLFLSKGKAEKEMAKSYIEQLKLLQLKNVQEKRTTIAFFNLDFHIRGPIVTCNTNLYLCIFSRVLPSLWIPPFKILLFNYCLTWVFFLVFFSDVNISHISLIFS